MRDLHHNSSYFVALDAQSVAATTNGIVVDTAGHDAAELIVNAGVFAFTGVNSISVKIQHGTLANGNDMADVPVEYLLGANIVLDDAADASSVFKQGYIGCERYVRAVFTEAGTVTAIMSATFELRPIHMPAPEQDATN